MNKTLAMFTTASLLLSAVTGPPIGANESAASAQSANASGRAAVTAPSLTLKWKTPTDGSGIYEEQQPVRNGMILYSADNTLYARNIATGQIKWSFKNGGRPQILTNHSVFFIDPNQQLVKVSLGTGKLIWKVKVAKRPMEIGGQARLINGKVIFANESGGIAAFHPVTGAKLWENNNIPMYAGSIYGEYKDTLVVSSTVNNIRSQFFGINPETGARIWRIEGVYSFLAHEAGQLVLLESDLNRYSTSPNPVPGHLLTLVNLDPATGKISNQQHYQPLEDVRGVSQYYVSTQGSYLYSADTKSDQDETILTRFARGQSSDYAFKTYDDFGSWVAGPVQGMAFFMKGAQLRGVNMADDSVVEFDHPSGKIVRVTRSGKVVFASFENGDFSILNASTGKLLGTLPTGAKHPYFGSIAIVNRTVLVPTESALLALALPKELQ
ncbi:PQQ-binding-like beta-propeller repeat protein [Paenibacillus sp. PK3_47]|uniref:PQQ-binding-like beta-propeller repeat protein n=1 Tax=Paenibacillus sp. PK3_47 TaxID=2072642 RepID=UPI00201D2DEE|nr:PQQ-binding-like beta-propeller repeat protein [Paenibacillus sp. PK3_47]